MSREVCFFPSDFTLRGRHSPFQSTVPAGTSGLNMPENLTEKHCKCNDQPRMEGVTFLARAYALCCELAGALSFRGGVFQKVFINCHFSSLVLAPSLLISCFPA